VPVGVGGIAPVDADRVDITSLNRLIGALLRPRGSVGGMVPCPAAAGYGPDSIGGAARTF
jgi:hypothetical protein